MKTEEQLTFNDDPIVKQYQSSFELIRKGEFEQAYNLYEEIIKKDVSLPEIFPVMKCLKFWINRKDLISKKSGNLERAAILQSEWRAFEKFLVKKDIGDLRFSVHFRDAVYFRIIDCYINEFQSNKVRNPDTLILLAEAFLEVAQYEKCRDTLIYAARFRPKDPMISVLTGEAWFFLGETDKAMAYYRDAFFYGPRTIRLAVIKAPPILKLIRTVEDIGFSGVEINIWLPVYAAVLGVFSVVSPLNARDLEQIQKKTYEYEIDYEIRKSSRGETEPILLNHYIFLLDFLKFSEDGDCQKKISALLRKIRAVNENIYHKLRKRYE